MTLVSWEPCFTVAELQSALDHHAQLGFATERHDDSYGFAIWGDLTIHLIQGGWNGESARSVVYLHVKDAKALAEHWRRAGATVDGPSATDYDLLEGVHVDPYGNVLRFGSPLPTEG